MEHYHEHHQVPSEGQPDHESRRFRFEGRCGGRGFRGGRDFGDHRGPFGGKHWGFAARFGGRGAGRIFEGGDLKYVLLQLIAEKPRHGYEIIKALEERSKGF